jgi:hypothetical protein
MYKLFILLFFALSVTLASSGQSVMQIHFAKKVLQAFKAKDFNSYKSVAINKKDLEEILTDGRLHGKIPRQDDYNIALTKFDEKADSSYKAEFNRIFKKGEQLGIEWKNVVLTDFVLKAQKAVNAFKTSITGHLNFICKGKNYVLFGIEAIELTSGLKLSSIRTVQEMRLEGVR